jgi:hypothetical protein
MTGVPAGALMETLRTAALLPLAAAGGLVRAVVATSIRSPLSPRPKAQAHALPPSTESCPSARSTPVAAPASTPSHRTRGHRRVRAPRRSSRHRRNWLDVLPADMAPTTPNTSSTHHWDEARLCVTLQS